MPRSIRQVPGGMALHVLDRGVGHPTLFHRVQYGFAAGGSSANQIRPTGLTYPSGRVITYDYGIANVNDDVLNRLE